VSGCADDDQQKKREEEKKRQTTQAATPAPKKEKGRHFPDHLLSVLTSDRRFASKKRAAGTQNEANRFRSQRNSKTGMSARRRTNQHVVKNVVRAPGAGQVNQQVVGRKSYSQAGDNSNVAAVKHQLQPAKTSSATKKSKQTNVLLSPTTMRNGTKKGFFFYSVENN